MTILTDETLGAFVGLAINGPAACQRMGYVKMMENGKAFLTEKPQLRDSLETALFSAHGKLQVSRSLMMAVAQEMLPALIREFAMFAIDQKVGGGKGTTTAPETENGNGSITA